MTHLTPKRLLDVGISLFLEFFVILTWHGLWVLLDVHFKYNLGHSHEYTAWMSIIVGSIISLFIFIFQFPFSKFIQDHQEKINTKNIFQWIGIRGLTFLFHLIGVCSTVNTFRGFWYLLDEYLILSMKFTSSMYSGTKAN